MTPFLPLYEVVLEILIHIFTKCDKKYGGCGCGAPSSGKAGTEKHYGCLRAPYSLDVALRNSRISPRKSSNHKRQMFASVQDIKVAMIAQLKDTHKRLPELFQKWQEKGMSMFEGRGSVLRVNYNMSFIVIYFLKIKHSL